MSSAPIALFDSGFGGLTVLREVMRELPNENIIYLGDTANLPYGNKSPEKIQQLALTNGQFLYDQGVKLLIVACHTACSQALTLLQKTLPIPVVGVVDAGIEELAQSTQNKKIAVLATSSTIQSGIYQKQLRDFDLFALACPLFVPLIEEGFQNTIAAEWIAREYLKPVIEKGCDAVLLACTHYPLLRPILSKILGPEVRLVEPAHRCAEQVKLLLATQGLLNPDNNLNQSQFFTTDFSEKFQALGSLFLGHPIQKNQLKKIDLSGMILSVGREQK